MREEKKNLVRRIYVLGGKHKTHTRCGPRILGVCRQAGLHISQGGCLTARTQGVTVYTLLAPCVSPYSISFHVSHFYELESPAGLIRRKHAGEQKKKGLRTAGEKKKRTWYTACSAIKSAEFKNLPGGYCIETWKIYSLRKKGMSLFLLCGGGV